MYIYTLKYQADGTADECTYTDYEIAYAQYKSLTTHGIPADIEVEVWPK